MIRYFADLLSFRIADDRFLVGPTDRFKHGGLSRIGSAYDEDSEMLELLTNFTGIHG